MTRPNLDTNAGQEARLKAKNKSASIKSVKFRYKGDFVEVRAVLKPGKKKGSFTPRSESAPAIPGFTAMAVGAQNQGCQITKATLRA